MISININDSEDKLLFKASGPQFSEIIDSFKEIGLAFNAKEKAWFGKIGLYEKYIESFHDYGLEINEYTKQFINNYKNSIKELVKIEKRGEYRKFDPSLMKFDPI